MVLLFGKKFGIGMELLISNNFMKINEFQSLSVTTLSHLTGAPISSWSRWLSGREMTAARLIEFSDKLKISPQDLSLAISQRVQQKANKVVGV
ncbi:MAG: hypothetical protein HC773_05630 [Scytonema sp. CRU_2_7]|nr:hypothetical protein [Scytonema sp. CRU_2_7]